MSELILLMGKPGSGKTSYYDQYLTYYTRVSQDEQGKNGHRLAFQEAIAENKDIVVDRQNHIREQREWYLNIAKECGYTTRIIEFKITKDEVIKRIEKRRGHPTLKHTADIRMIINRCVKDTQAVSDDEVDTYEEIVDASYREIGAGLHESLTQRENLVNEGYLSKSENGELILYNYTDKCTYDRNWNKTTKSSRGTIYNKHTGKLVAKAFPKFFNLEENSTSKTVHLPWKKAFKVFEKLDGSFGTLYRQDGKFKIATRGSFYSEQAVIGTKMLEDYKLDHLDDDVTLLFEIIYQANKIVVNYGDRWELVVLGGYRGDEEMPWLEVAMVAETCGFTLAKQYDWTLRDMLAMKPMLNHDEHEGWVVRFFDNRRVKIKCDKYMEMAKIMSQVSPLSIWEAMLNKTIEEYMKTLPEELRESAEEIEKILFEQFTLLEHRAGLVAEEIGIYDVDLTDQSVVKPIAVLINSQPKWQRGYLFAAMRGIHADDYLLKLMRPTGNVYVEVEKLYKVGVGD